MKTERMVIVDGVRTPFCKAGTSLADLPADELGRVAVRSLLARTGMDPAILDEVIIGCVGQPPEAANLARVIALRAGIPEHVPAVTVHRNCASGCEAITTAATKIAAGMGEIFIVGGTESMSRLPLLFSHTAAKKFGRLMKAKNWIQKPEAVTAFRPSDFKPRVGLMLGLSDPVSGLNMGETAELIIREFGLSREEQDLFALRSHSHALAARERLAEEICPVYLAASEEAPAATRDSAVTHDNGPRANQTLEALTRLKPVFDRKNGTVTAGNASQVTDGAVALLVTSERKAHELGLTPLGALTHFSYAGCDPARMGLGPAYAISEAERATHLRPADADLVEINEAFAGQVLAVQTALSSEKFNRKALKRLKTLGAVPLDRLNVNGGAIALGHPVGATGARLVLTALKELKRRKGKRALVSLCVGGGQGAALWMEAL